MTTILAVYHTRSGKIAATVKRNGDGEHATYSWIGSLGAGCHQSHAGLVSDLRSAFAGRKGIVLMSGEELCA